ncbi:MAG: flavin-nucleotide-binding protein [Candidatus Lokiarchaeota archaeon]|nr:flavin-nucleotide-binding protein [Candidatus Lokiarchaeota archaeon]
MRGIRRKEKEITEETELLQIIKSCKYVTLAMCTDNEPYLVTLSYGFDEENRCMYFHCANEGKKIDILKQNPIVWGQVIIDEGYVTGKCDHLYASVQFKGIVTFLESADDKRYALRSMIDMLEYDPDIVYKEQVTEKSVKRVMIGRIDIEHISGKKSKNVIISV